MSNKGRIVGALVRARALGVALATPATAEDYQATRHAEVDFSPASLQALVGSPSLVVLPNGGYLASHAEFGPGATVRTTQVFRSRNGGVAWGPVGGSPVQPMTWATILQMRGTVYLMGVVKAGRAPLTLGRGGHP